VSFSRIFRLNTTLTVRVSYREVEMLPLIFGWCYVGFMGVHVINVSATAFTLSTLIGRNYNVRDKVCKLYYA